MPRIIMLIPIGSGVGLTTISLGLVRALEREGVRINFFKPVAQLQLGDKGPERSSEIIRRASRLAPPEPFQVNHVENLISKMSQLKAHGIHLALDDFGAGYSSLNYLKRLPLDQLKIDQSFVHDLLEQPSNAAIVRTILALGDNLGLSVTAEGVETQAQFEALKQMGCRRFQGYLFAKPGPASALAQWPATG